MLGASLSIPHVALLSYAATGELTLSMQFICDAVPVGNIFGSYGIAGQAGPFTCTFTSNPGNYFEFINGNEIALASVPPIGEMPIAFTITNGSSTISATDTIDVLATPTQPATGLPLDGNLLNVKTYGATGNGTTDDTAAILAAIAALPVYQTNFNLLTQIIYFPAGTYLVSDTIQRTATNIRANLILVGEDKSTTFIKLANSASGFTSAGTPKPVIQTNSGDVFGQSPFGNTTGAGNEGFDNTVQNLTIRLGTGNAGAVGIDWQVNNIGCIRDVDVTTTGAALAGIAVNRNFVGPGLVTSVNITGPFQYGVLGYSSALGFGTNGPGYSIGFEHIAITGTTVTGILNSQNVFACRDVTITCASGYGVDVTDASGVDIVIPFGSNEGLFVWVDGTITGNGTAPVNGAGGWRNWTNVQVVSFNGSLTEDLSGVYQQATIIGTSDWQITPKNTPVAPVVATNTWKKIIAATYPGDATAAFQAVLSDPTVTVAYLPCGYYNITGPITIADNVQRIEFLYSYVDAEISGDYAFVVNATRTSDLFINNLIMQNTSGGLSGIVHWLAPARLIISDSSGPMVASRPSTGGEIYIENVNSSHIEVSGTAGVFMRQFNPEVGSTKIFSDTNTPIWMFGSKAEQDSTLIESDGAGNFEWVGGYQFVGDEDTSPLFNVTAGGRISGSFAIESLSSGAKVDTVAQTTINSISNTVPGTLFPQRGHYDGRILVNFSSDKFVPSVLWGSPSVIYTATIGTVIATAALSTDYAYAGTPVWSLTDNDSGKYAINSSTGVVTVAAALAIGTDHITITVSGLTFGATGTPTFTPKICPINVSSQSSSTFDPANKGTGITLSNNNLTATANTSDSSGKSVTALDTVSHSTGKYYFETTLVTNAGAKGNVNVGFAASAFTAGSQEMGFSGTSSVMFGGGDSWYLNSVTNTYPNLAAGFGNTGDVIGWAVDLTARKVWWTKNGTSWNTDILANQNPATPVGGFDISTVTGALFFGVELDDATSQMKVNTGGTGFTYTAPSTFTGAW